MSQPDRPHILFCPFFTWTICFLGVEFCKTVWRFLKKLKTGLPTIQQLHYSVKDTKVVIQRDTCTPPPCLTAALSTVAKFWKEPKCPLTDGWIKKFGYTHTHTLEYYSTIKMNEILPFAMMWVELESIMLSKISQTEKEKTHMISLICRI